MIKQTLKSYLESQPGQHHHGDFIPSEPIKVKVKSRIIDLTNHIDEDRWREYTITLCCANCFFAADGRSKPWWAVKEWRIVDNEANR